MTAGDFNVFALAYVVQILQNPVRTVFACTNLDTKKM